MSGRRRVVELYRQILWLGREYPGGLDEVRRKAKAQFQANANVTDPAKLEELYQRAEYVIGELEAFRKFHKYRTLRRRYVRDD